jgi:lysophospholipase L1-like esterase
MDRRWLLGGVLLAGGYGFARALTYRPPLDSNSRILLIGDSLAQGMLPHFQALSSEAKIPYVGTGIPGTRVDQWVHSDWLVRKLVELSPTHVFVSLGTNDAFTNLSDASVRQSAKQLVAMLKKSGANVIWIGAPRMPETYGGKPFRPEIIETIRSVAPFYFDSSNYNIPRGPDLLHPSAGGYAGWAGAIWNWIA